MQLSIRECAFCGPPLGQSLSQHQNLLVTHILHQDLAATLVSNTHSWPALADHRSSMLVALELEEVHDLYGGGRTIEVHQNARATMC